MKMVFVNVPVRDLEQSVAFYEKLGFKRNDEFSNEVATAVAWDENVWFMLLTPDFYAKFIGEKKIADTQTTSGALIALSMPSAQAVKDFARIAGESGGGAYHVEMGIPEDQMYALEVQDPDGNMLEAVWMQMPS